MAIAFVDLRFAKHRRRDSAARMLAYLARRGLRDAAGNIVGYSGSARDFVGAEIRLPHEAPAAFEDLGQLGAAIDAAENKKKRKTRSRKRWPQGGALLTAAIPPDEEISLDEALEFVARLVDRVIGDRSLIAVSVLHDPRRTMPNARNRHAHVYIALRVVDRAGFGKKSRDLFARARACGDGSNFVAEGVDWPQLAIELQNAFFAELGIDCIVDPPSPRSDRHWPQKTLDNEPERVADYRRNTQAQNLEILHGPADTLIEEMLRGRGAMPVEEVRRLVDRFIDSEHERRQRLEQILADPSVIPLSDDEGASRPSWITARKTHALMNRAVDLVHAASHRNNDPQATRISVVSQNNAGAVDRYLAGHVRMRPLLVGSSSACEPLLEHLEERAPGHMSAAAFVAEQPAPRASPTWPAIVVPRAERLDDRTLAKIITRADEAGAELLLGYDESAAAGIAGQRLAAYAADMLAGSAEQAHGSWIERHLRAGQFDRALRAMHEHGVIVFAQEESQALMKSDFVVCLEGDLPAMTERLRAAHGPQAGLTPAGMPSAGAWIAITQTSYSCIPPVLREGRLARVIDVTGDTVLSIEFPDDGTTATIDARDFPHFRSAAAITLREARRAPPSCKLIIDIRSVRHAWAMVLLAACRKSGTSIVRVDPTIAGDIGHLVRVVRRSLPAPLPSALVPWQAAPIITEPLPDLEDWLEDMPVPESARPNAQRRALDRDAIPGRPPLARVASNIPRDLHADLRRILAKPDGEAALRRLTLALSPERADRQTTAKKLLHLCERHGPTETLVNAILARNSVSRPNPMADLDLTEALAAAAPAEWSLWDLYKFEIDLATMTCMGTVWQAAFNDRARGQALEPNPSAYRRH